VRDHDEATIQLQIEYLEFRLAGKKADKIDDPAAWLISAIKHPHTAPKGFIGREEQQQREEARQAKEREKADARRQEREQDAEEKAVKQAVATYRKQLTLEQLGQHEADALAQADAETQLNYQATTHREFKRMLRDSITDGYIRRILQTQPADA
jgi:FKBP-type peptidyl-prolyl cis-trans isomerase (trigger factor)